MANSGLRQVWLDQSVVVRMRHRALPYLLPALHALPPLLSSLYADLGFRRQRVRAEKGFRQRVIPSVNYTQAMIAPRLQTQLRPWLSEIIASPELLAGVIQRMLAEVPAALQEALYWAYTFEAGTRLVAASDSGPRNRETRDLRVLFVPLICEQERWAPTLPPMLMQAMRELLYVHGIVQPDEAVLVAPASLPPHLITDLLSYTRIVEFALAGAEAAWGPAAAPAVEMDEQWEQWWRQPEAPAGAATLRPLELRLALLVVASPDPGAAVLDTLQPWQQEVRTELLLIDRFDSGVLLETESQADLSHQSQQAFIGWIDSLNDLLFEAGTGVIAAAPPSDAYAACGRGAVEAGCQFVRQYEELEDDEAPIYLIGDAAGLGIELEGESHRLAWAPDGVLMPAMLPVIEEVMHAVMRRRVERSVTQDLDSMALIGRL